MLGVLGQINRYIDSISKVFEKKNGIKGRQEEEEEEEDGEKEEEPEERKIPTKKIMFS